MCGLVHYQLGIVASIGAIALTAVTFLTERASRVHSRKLTAETGIRSAMLEGNRQNNELAAAMGMGAALAGRWTALNDRYAATMRKSSDVIGGFGSFSKALRLLLQSAMLGLGAYLVIRQEMTAVVLMIAASTIMSRGLAPIELAIANWRGFVGARDSIRRLSETLSRLVVKDNATELPRPSRSLEVATFGCPHRTGGPCWLRALSSSWRRGRCWASSDPVARAKHRLRVPSSGSGRRSGERFALTAPRWISGVRKHWVATSVTCPDERAVRRHDCGKYCPHERNGRFCCHISRRPACWCTRHDRPAARRLRHPHR